MAFLKKYTYAIGGLRYRPQFRTISSYLKNIIDLHPSVSNALNKGKPIVALESTIITHGMPYPNNLDTALEVEEVVRSEGVIPATIAIMNGRIKVGLNSDELKQLASMSSKDVVKCSRRDLPYMISKRLNGGTTVAGTMIIAHMVGLKIFATGGIGGVHREGQDTFDISADLIELGRTPVAVVSSGVKSILDIPRTLEFLETQGVFVASYQSNFNFPDFYTAKSGIKVPYNVDNPKEAAALIAASLGLNLNSGVLIGVPVPEEYAIDKKLIDSAINAALRDAKEKHIKGKDVTPFLLSAIAKITKGKSLQSNIALIKNNAKTAAKIAREMYKEPCQEFSTFNEKSKIPIVIGASILDLCLTVQDDFQLNGATYHVNSKLHGGGVGRNMAEGLSKLYGPVRFITAIGEDAIGQTLRNTLPNESISTILADTSKSTSMCSVIFDKDGDCKLVLGNMHIHKSITPDLVETIRNHISAAPLIVIDGNLSSVTMQKVLEIALEYEIPVFFEPTDMRIAGKPFKLPSNLTSTIKFISPNIYELQEISKVINGDNAPNLELNNKNNYMKSAKVLLKSINEHFDCIILTLGELGVIVDRKKTSNIFFDSTGKYNSCSGMNCKRSTRFYPAIKVDKLVNVSGAGDSFSSGFIANALKGKEEIDCVSSGFEAAGNALQSESAVPPVYFVSVHEKNNISNFTNLNYTEL